MTKKCLLLVAVAIIGSSFAGCYSTNTSTFVGPRKIKVVDSLTQRPIAGAHVELYSSAGQCMGQATDERGDMRVASGLLTAGVAKYDRIEVSRDGYDSVAFQLTNGLPHRIELIETPNHK
jgi:hypothetical protein